MFERDFYINKNVFIYLLSTFLGSANKKKKEKWLVIEGMKKRRIKRKKIKK